MVTEKHYKHQCLHCCVIGTVRRRCIGSDQWEEFFDCFREETRKLLDQVIIAEHCKVIQNWYDFRLKILPYLLMN